MSNCRIVQVFLNFLARNFCYVSFLVPQSNYCDPDPCGGHDNVTGAFCRNGVNTFTCTDCPKGYSAFGIPGQQCQSFSHYNWCPK